MGVTYKLKPEINHFIIEQKRSNPALSCRDLARLIEQKYQIKVSKSSINSAVKSAGLSMPVGRRKGWRRKVSPTEKPQPEVKLLSAPAPAPPAAPQEKEEREESTGAILLKAVDSLIGGSRYLSEILRKSLEKKEPELLAHVEGLIYLPLFEAKEGEKITALSALIGKEISIKDILLYNDLWQSLRINNREAFSGIIGLSQQVRGIKVLFTDNKSIYLDSQFRTVWPTSYIPFDFSTTLYNTKSYINKYFFQNQPLLLFIAPGEDAPSAEFFAFILALNAQGNRLERLILYDNKLQELQRVNLGQLKRYPFLYGLLPGQFREYRTISKVSEFRPFFCVPLQKELYLAEARIDLSQPYSNQVVTLKACILKNAPSDNPYFIIGGHNLNEEGGVELFANTYLNHWPDPQESCRDFIRKVEFFSYLGDSQGVLTTAKVNFSALDAPQAKALFGAYLELLHLYFKDFFLPAELKNMDFPTIKREFYSLKATLAREKTRLSVSFAPPPGFSFQKPLEYACRRLNEREIELSDGRRLMFKFAPADSI